jgi:hypothetical protein
MKLLLAIISIALLLAAPAFASAAFDATHPGFAAARDNLESLVTFVHAGCGQPTQDSSGHTVTSGLRMTDSCGQNHFGTGPGVDPDAIYYFSPNSPLLH